MIQTIKDIYDYRRDDNSPMLSDFEPSGDIDFWEPYRDNFPYFDRLFMKKYRSWFPMDQEGDIEDVAIDFAYDVKSWLMINTKRYAELYRIETIPDDEKYSLTDNVFEHEEIKTDFGKKVTFNKGEQEIKDEGYTDYALHETETGVTDNLGATEVTTENSTSAFNESTYTPTDKKVESGAAVQNGSSTTVTDKAHKDENGNTRTDGAREDTTEDSGDETVTRDRAGNIGIKDVPQIFMDQRDFWVSFAYYDFIFSEITRELLRGVM